MNPGRPVYLRPTILGVLIPVVLVSLIVLVEKGDPEFAKAGDCIHNSNPIVVSGAIDSNPDVTVVPCSDPRAEARVVGRKENTDDGETVCRNSFPDADGYFTYRRGSDKYTLCLHSLKQKPSTVFLP